MTATAIERLAAAVPGPVEDVCRELRAAGYEAWTVGGAVRDVLLGGDPQDWDVTTDAHPDEVVKLFSRTIPTGIQHGTVTVMVGRGSDRQGVEVTTFRGEGAYSDARRPDSVTFGVPLDEDLARRDFVVNAMAYDPVGRRLHDPFGGQADIAARQIRAVGVARDRFLEDGLRVMRAVRFVSSLDFELEAETERAIPEATPSLARVAKERVRVELVKLLQGQAVGRALDLARRVGVIDVIFPELNAVDFGQAVRRVEAVEADLCLRLGALCAELAPEVVDAALRRLTFSNADRGRVVAMVRYARPLEPPPADDASLRRHLARIGRAALGDVLLLWRAESTARGGDAGVDELCLRATETTARGDPLTVGELPISGADVARIGGLEPGPTIGAVLAELLARVLDDPALADAERLRELVPEICSELGE